MVGTARISVLRGAEVVPLVPGAPPRAMASPWDGLIVERHRLRSMEIPEHEHAEFCLHLQTSGDVGLEWWCEGKHGLEKPRAGAMILLGPGTRDRLRWQGDSERVILSLAPAALARAAEEMGSVAPVEFRNLWMLQDDALRLLMTEIGRETSAGWPLGKLYGDVLRGHLAELLLRRFATAPLTGERVGGLSLGKLRRVMEFVSEHLPDDLRLNDLAAVAGVSESHFARMFRRSTGQSAHGYVLEQRMRRAQVLLRSTKRSAAQIAAEVGVPNAAHFGRVFRQRFGVSPGEWRAG